MASDGASYALKWSIPKDVPPEAAGSSAAQPASSWLEAAHLSLLLNLRENFVPIYEVAYDNGKWWTFQLVDSLAFYQHAANGENARYQMNKGQFREYLLDFEAMAQINIANDRRRSLRVAWVKQDQITPSQQCSTVTWGRVSRAAQSASSWLETAIVPVLPPAHAAVELVPIFEIMYADGMLWSLPEELSKEIYENTYGAQRTKTTQYTEYKKGKFEAYIFDVEKMRCENIDSDHEGPLRLAWVKPEELTASFTGQIPGAKKKRSKK